MRVDKICLCFCEWPGLLSTVDRPVCFSDFAAMVVFPSSLTEEEEALQKKYAKLRKKVRGY